MRISRRTAVKIGLLIVAGMAVAWFFTTRSRPSSAAVAFLNYTTNGAGTRAAHFTITNRTSFPVGCPSIFMEIRATGKIADTASSEMIETTQLQPNETRTFTVEPPAPAGAWRLLISLYPDDARNRIKMKIDTSTWRKFIPAGWRGVRGENVWSDWIPE